MAYVLLYPQNNLSYLENMYQFTHKTTWGTNGICIIVPTKELKVPREYVSMYPQNNLRYLENKYQ